MQYLSRFLSIMSILCILSGVKAQTGTSIQEPVVSSYRIKVTIAGTPENVLYLQGYAGGRVFIVDSANVKSGTAVFKNKANPLPCGIYSIATRQDSVLMDIIVNTDAVFSVSTTQAGLYRDRRFDGSEENATLLVFQRRLAQLPEHTHAAVQNLTNEYIETAPQSFLSKYLNAAFCDTGFETCDSTPRAMSRRLYNAIGHTDFGEPRLLHCPLPIYSLLNDYLTGYEIHDTHILLAVTDTVLQRCSHQAVKKFYLNYFFNLFDRHDPDFDPILLHLYDDFDHSWITPEYAPWYHKKVERIRKIVPGAQIPNVISHDILGKAHSTDEIRTRYTVLWFWDPDCDHCITETPKLHQLYQEYGEHYDFEVFAVEVNGDYDRWKKFSDKFQLWDWINLCTAMGDANYDFFDYFDIMTTPVLFLVDNSHNHTIIARQITLEELVTFFNEQYQN